MGSGTRGEAADGAHDTLVGSARLRTIALGVAAPAAAFVSAHYVLITSYSNESLSRSTAIEQYAHGVYRYRIVGREAVLWLSRHVPLASPEPPGELARIGPPFSATFYNALSLFNGVCFVAAMGLLLVLLRRALEGVAAERLFLMVLFVTTLSLGVVTPYDCLGYALLVASAWVARWSGLPALVAIAALMVLGTANRESQYLVVPLLAAAAWSASGPARRRLVVATGVAGAACAATYVALRVWLGTDDAVIAAVSFLAQGIDGVKGVGIGVALVAATACVVPGPTTRGVSTEAVFLVAATPYLVAVVAGGLLLELRLWVPLLLVRALVPVVAEPAATSARRLPGDLGGLATG